MKIFDIKTASMLGLSILIFSTAQVDAQGFFSRKKKEAEPISASLFPSASDPGYVTSSAPSAPQESAIFKDGQPQEVRATSYILRDGEKIEKKRNSLFGFGRNKASGDSEGSDHGNETPTFEPGPAIATENASPMSGVPTKERRFGLPNLSLPSLPKFHRKDQGPIDTTGAEILVNNGGTLAPSGTDTAQDDVQYRTIKSNSTTKTPPRNEDGSIVYNSWADVSAQKTSAADQIVRDMKAQEADHKAKIEAAKREYEDKVKKAEADARIRAIMQGSMVPPPG